MLLAKLSKSHMQADNLSVQNALFLVISIGGIIPIFVQIILILWLPEDQMVKIYKDTNIYNKCLHQPDS